MHDLSGSGGNVTFWIFKGGGGQMKLHYQQQTEGLALLLKTHSALNSGTFLFTVLLREAGDGVNNERRLFEGGVYFPLAAGYCGDYSRAAFNRGNTISTVTITYLTLCSFNYYQLASTPVWEGNN